MKPRLPAAPWTPEDDLILWRLIVRGKWAGSGRTMLDYRPADRRDADIMLSLGRSVFGLRAVDPVARCMWLLQRAHGGGFSTRRDDVACLPE